MRPIKTVLQKLLERQTEVRFGRTCVRMICYAVGVVVFLAGVSATDFTVSWALGLTGCLFLIAFAKKISVRVFADVLVGFDTLEQIEREEGWFDKGLVDLFYAKHGEPSPPVYDEASISKLSPSGPNFDAAARGVTTGEHVSYPLYDVIQLVEASSKLSGDDHPSSLRCPGLSFKAMSYVAVCFFVAGFGVSLGVFTTALRISGKM